MTDHSPDATVVVARSELVRLTELMGNLDRFLRGQPNDQIWAVLRAHAQRPGQPDAGYLIDMVSLSAARLHRLLDESEPIS